MEYLSALQGPPNAYGLGIQMSYLELRNTMFRGTLRAATGQTQFKLTAEAINAVDTVNIGDGAVTYNTFVYTPINRNVSNGTELTRAYINIPEGTYIEYFVASDTAAVKLYVDGVLQPTLVQFRTGRGLGVPLAGVLPLSVGVHTLVLQANQSAYCGVAYIVVRYYRSTGGT